MTELGYLWYGREFERGKYEDLGRSDAGLVQRQVGAHQPAHVAIGDVLRRIAGQDVEELALELPAVDPDIEQPVALVRYRVLCEDVVHRDERRRHRDSEGDRPDLRSVSPGVASRALGGESEVVEEHGGVSSLVERSQTVAWRRDRRQGRHLFPRCRSAGRPGCGCWRAACAAQLGSWVTMMMVVPASLTSCRRSMISLRRRRVEVAGRLVGEDQPGAAGERAGDRDALLLAAGELRRQMVEARREADAADLLLDAPLPLRCAEAAVAQRHVDVVEHVEVGDQVEALEDEADLLVADPRLRAIREPARRRRRRARRCRTRRYRAGRRC